MAISRNTSKGGWNASVQFTGTLFTGDAVPKAIKDEMAALPGYAIPILQRNSPVRTGFLRSAWKVTTGSRTLSIVNPAYYAGFVDKGTRRIRPREFVDKSVKEIVSEFKKRAGDRIVEYAGGKATRKNTREALAKVNKLTGPIRPIRTPITKNGVPIYGGSGR